MFFPFPGPGRAIIVVGGGGGGALNDGDPVASWPDSSTNGNNATQTGTARPTFKTNIVNGKPVVRYASANGQSLNLQTPISNNEPFVIFAVMKRVAALDLYTLCHPADTTFTSNAALQHRTDDYLIAGSDQTLNYYPPSGFGSVFHVFTIKSVGGVGGNKTLYLDGATLAMSPQGSPGPTPFTLLGKGDGDIAEFIFYNGDVALRAKLLVVLTVLITTGQIPSTEEADALLAAGDLVALEAYLIEHGVPVEQARDTLEPMTVGDRANIEKYLGTKYGITVAGGTAVQPDTVAGLMGWWKADSLAAAPAVHLLDTLISYWKLDEASGGSFRNDSQGTNHLTPVGLPVGVAGKINNGVQLVAASSQYIGIPSNTSLQVTSDFTFSFWINFATVTSNMSIISKDTGVAGSRDYAVYYHATLGFVFTVTDPFTVAVDVGAPTSAGVWTHVVAWYDSGTSLLHLRINDTTSYVSSMTSALSQSTAAFFLGQSGGGAQYVDGIVDEVGFWKRKLTAAEITTLYNGGAGLPFSSFTGSAFDPTTIAGLKLWLKADALALADGTAVGTWPDSSGNAYNLSAIGSQQPTFKTNIVNGKPVLRFDGGNNQMKNLSDIGVAQPNTIIAVGSGNVTAAHFAFIWSGGPGSQVIVFLHASGQLYMNSANAVSAINDAVNHSGAFHVVSAVFNGASSAAYVDGTSVGTANMGTAGVGDINIMTDAASFQSAGDYAELLIYNSALGTTDRQNVEAYLKAKYGL